MLTSFKNKDVFKKEIERINSKIPLDEITHHLAGFLVKNIVHSIEKRESVRDQDACKLTQVCVFLSGKMSERDINIPTSPDIVVAGGMILMSNFV